MKLTVAICTYNRCRLLADSLASIAGARVPESVDWEVVVVDNRCTDETPEVVERFASALPVRRVEESRPGISHARNRAVETARGDYIVWTDDDVRVTPAWLEAYADAFERWPDAAFFGGPMRPLFAGDQPRWLVDGWEEVRWAYPVRELGEEAFEITDRRNLPYGANFALPMEIQAERAYDPQLGRSGTDLLGGEETEFLATLLDEGRTGRWVPGAELKHVILPKQQTLAYLRQYYRDLGRLSEFRRLRRDGDGPAVTMLWGRPRWAWKSAVVGEIRYRLGRRLRGPRDWLAHLREASRAQGVLMGAPEAAEERRNEEKFQW